MSYPTGNNVKGRRGHLLPSVLSVVAVLILGLYSSGLSMPHVTTALLQKDGQIEPDAGTWKTWVLTSGDQLRLPAPPGNKATKEEIEVMLDLAERRDAADLERIAYWNAGSPVYRWNRLTVDMAIDKNLNALTANRHLALLNTALEDAVIAAWDSKYAFERPRPSEFSSKIDPVIPVPNSPSYPSEHAVVAGAASRILAYIFPDNAADFATMEEDAARAFRLTGTQYPSDVEAGLELGHAVADAAIAYASDDGFNVPWTGTVPTDPTQWTGTNPVLPGAANWRTWVLDSPDELRPGPPFAFNSPELSAEMDYLRTLVRDGRMTAHAFFWEYGSGGVRNFWFWNDHLSRMTLEYHLDDNAPMAARAYALLNVAMLDATVACWDAKYTYWAIRPFQYDPTFKPLFTTPNHPSYPSAHSCISVASSDVLAYLFPTHGDEFTAFATEAGNARVWAGLHFLNDVVVGTNLGHDVSEKVIEYAGNDGSQ